MTGTVLRDPLRQALATALIREWELLHPETAGLKPGRILKRRDADRFVNQLEVAAREAGSSFDQFVLGIIAQNLTVMATTGADDGAPQ